MNSNGNGFHDKLSLLRRRIANDVSRSHIARFLTSDTRIEQEIEGSGFIKKSREGEFASLNKRLRVGTARRMENSALTVFYRRIIHGLLNASAKVYATFFISFAIYTAAVFFIRTYAFNLNNGKYEDLAIAAAMFALGVMLMFSDRSFIELVGSSAFGRVFLVKVLGVREAMLKPGTKCGGAIVAFIIGTVVGASTVLFSPLSVLGVLLVAATAMLAFSAPECGVAVLLLIAPFAQTQYFAAGVCFVLFAYIIKVIRFKRNLKLGGAGTAVLLFLINVLLSGAVSASYGDGVGEALMLVLSISCFFLCANLISTGKLVYCCVRALLIGTAVASSLSVLRAFLPILENAVTVATGTGIISATVIAVGAVVFAQRSRVNYSFFARIGSLLCVAIAAAAIFFIGDVGSWIVFLAGTIMLCMCMYPLSAIFFAIVGALSPLWWKLLASTGLYDAVNSYFASASSSAHLADTAMGSFAFGGIGTGESALLMATGMQTGGGTVFSRLIAQSGVFGLLLFIGALVLIIIRIMSKILICKKKPYRALTAALICAAFGILVNGVFAYVWADLTTCAMFWSLCGLACAAADAFGEDPDAMIQ